MSSSQRFTILLFGALKDLVGRDELEIEIVGETVCVADVVRACETACPKLQAWTKYIRVAVDCEYAHLETLVTSHQEIALLPPVAGG